VDELAVRFSGSEGIADSDWLLLAPGISVLTGRNNVGKSRLLQLTVQLAGAVGNAPQYPNVPQVRLVVGDLQITADLRGAPPPAVYEVRKGGGPVLAATWSYVGGQPQLMYEEGGAQRLVVQGVPLAIGTLALPELPALGQALADITICRHRG